MADEPEAIAQVASEPIPTSEPEVEQPVNLNAPVEEHEPSPETEPVEDLEDFEWEGRPVKLPKGMKAGFMMNADYTQKTQAVSERQKALDARESAIAQQAKASEEDLQIRATAYQLNREIEQYAQVNWEQWEAEDPVAAGQGWRRYSQLRLAAEGAQQEIAKRQNERTLEAQRNTAKRLEETRKFAETNIKGWTPEIDAKVTSFATGELGFQRDALINAYSPQVYRALHLAFIGHQALQQAASRPSAAPVVPLTTVASKASPPARKTLGDMNMEEYAAYRQKQNAQGR